MSYKPTTGTSILDNDFRLATSEGVYEALALKQDTLPAPTAGANLTYNGTSLEWRLAGIGPSTGAQLLPSNTILFGRTKPTNLSGVGSNVIIGTGTIVNSVTTSSGSVVIGHNSSPTLTTATGITAIGASSNAIGSFSIAIGNQANTIAAEGTAVGAGASAEGHSVVLGRSALATSTSAIAIGSNATVGGISATSSIAIGRSATANNEPNVFALGSNSYQISKLYLGQGAVPLLNGLFSSVTIMTQQGATFAPGGNVDASAGTLVLAGAQGTGSGLGSSVIIATAPAGGSGTSINPHVNRLEITQSGETRFLGSTSGYVGVSSPDSPTSYSLVLPSSQGASNTVLTNDGSGNLSWQAAGGGGGNPNAAEWFGPGFDGDLTLTSATYTGGPLSNGILTRDAYFNNLTISGAGRILTNGWRIFVRGTLDISGAAGVAITSTVNAGGSATTNVGGLAGTAAYFPRTVGSTLVGYAGGSGGNTAGTTGNGVVSTSFTIMQGGLQSTSTTNGKGGNAGANVGGNGGILTGAAVPVNYFGVTQELTHSLGGPTFNKFNVPGGIGGVGGGGGAGDGTNAGGGGGGGGASGGVIYIAADTINRSSSNAVGTIAANGGTGGNGATRATGNVGGGGGGAGGGGGFIYVLYRSLTGSSATNLITANGGNGGTAGNGVGTGLGGNGGAGGGAGMVILIDVSNNSGSVTGGQGAATAGNAGSGITGGTGGTGGTTQVTL